MQNIFTHYDNLKVSRNAPPEVIRAAYKTLSQKYHPDRNLNNSEASRIMAILNASYEVLSDPEKRKDHDLWIAEKESISTKQNKNNQASTPTPNPAPNLHSNKITLQNIFSHVIRFWFIYLFVFLWAWGALTEKTKPSPPPSPVEYIATPTTEAEAPPAPASHKPNYEKPLYAPNGEVWPSIAGYVSGYKKLNTNGLSTVTVDNSQNDSDVFVKLVFLGNDKAYPVRQFYIPAFGQFTVNKVKAGSYDIRYRDLDNGGLSRSESFNLEETEVSGGTQFSKYTMTLYKVRDGNMQTYDLSESDF